MGEALYANLKQFYIIGNLLFNLNNERFTTNTLLEYLNIEEPLITWLDVIGLENRIE